MQANWRGDVPRCATTRSRVIAVAALLSLGGGCGSSQRGSTPISDFAGPVPDLQTATAIMKGFKLELATDGLARDNAIKVRDAWQVAACVIRSGSFWDKVDTLTGDESGLLRDTPAGTRMRQVAARGLLQWYREWGAGARLRVAGISLPRRRKHEHIRATVYLGGGTIRLRRWHVQVRLEELAATLVHEWLHTVGFQDPTVQGDRVSVVYGMTPIALAIAAGNRCGTVPDALYINPSRSPKDAGF